MKRYFLLVTIFISLLNASYIDVDSSILKLNKFKYETPNANEIKIPKGIKLIVVSFEKETGAFINGYLNSQSPNYLKVHDAVFIADINNIPSIITKMFALPKLRKYKHPIYINYDEKFQDIVPSKEEMVTLIHVKESVVTDISYISNAEELKMAIEKHLAKTDLKVY